LSGGVSLTGQAPLLLLYYTFPAFPSKKRTFPLPAPETSCIFALPVKHKNNPPYDMETIEITRKKFTENLEMYFKMIESGTQVVLTWEKNKASVTPIPDDDACFTPEALERIKQSMAQIKAGQGIKLTKEKQKELLGL
jgi:hypothetical protein